ncbi:MAG TPA: TetR/AcrR family transcriptional regulator [Saprospiraceae bacterium]|nr:TetR family transcriptional regulator [Saprospiraceae bacterium]HRO08688.1 TetR/AcrR family transcriptional regulator [Saprospiraceae bacterium]HRP41999.1 TetR/AcrR family transcriptional regulator [Saprospiraceae bacterium]
MAPLSKEQFEAQRQASKMKIIVVALELFSKKGFINTSINDIAKTANISKGLMYNYFESKDVLLEECLKMVLEGVVGGIQAATQIKNPEERLEFLIRTSFDMLKENPHIWKMFVSLSLQLDKESASYRILNEYWSQLFKNAVSIFKEMGYEDYEERAFRYGAMMDGLAMQYILLGEENILFDKTLQGAINIYCYNK